MDLQLSASELAFRDEVRAWTIGNLDPAVRENILNGGWPSLQERLAWWRKLNEVGWLAPNWPVEHGGTGWTIVQKHIFDEVQGLEGAPDVSGFALRMLGPLLIRFGSEAQKAYYLPRMLESADIWCQGFSEPEAGSDLASVRTRAVRGADHWTVNGQKIWTTNAHEANLIFVLLRTSAAERKHEGLSILLVDLRSPGVEVRPIRMIDGHHHVNEVFFTNVEVPLENLLGEEGKAWDYAKALLANERTGLARLGQLKRQLMQLKATGAIARGDRAVPLADPEILQRMKMAEIEVRALEITNLRMLSREQAGGQIGPEASLLKMKSAELQQQLATLALDIAGASALLAPGECVPVEWAAPDFLSGSLAAYAQARKASVYGGSSEIQHNIIAKALF